MGLESANHIVFKQVSGCLVITTRADVAGGIYHAWNRSNASHYIFFNDGVDDAFERIVAEGLVRFPVDLIAT